jgi:hypothetical protein
MTSHMTSQHKKAVAGSWAVSSRANFEVKSGTQLAHRVSRSRKNPASEKSLTGCVG